jgi:hypothetical protein
VVEGLVTPVVDGEDGETDVEEDVDVDVDEDWVEDDVVVVEVVVVVVDEVVDVVLLVLLEVHDVEKRVAVACTVVTGTVTVTGTSIVFTPPATHDY